MFRTLLLAAVLLTLLVNVIFLLATHERTSLLRNVDIATAKLAASGVLLPPDAIRRAQDPETNESPTPAIGHEKRSFFKQRSPLGSKERNLGNHLMRKPLVTSSPDRGGASVEEPLALEKHRPENKSLSIRVLTSKTHVFVEVGGAKVYEVGRAEAGSAPVARGRAARQSSRNGEGRRGNCDASQPRGIHVVVLNQRDGSVMAKRRFDTYSAGQDGELRLFLEHLQPGRFVVFAVGDEASFHLGEQARDLLQSRRWASEQVGLLQWRDMWAYVVKCGDKNGVTSGLNLAETLSKSLGIDQWGQARELQARVVLDDGNQLQCNFRSHDKLSVERRQRFCQQVEGYAGVCDCDHPSAIDFEPRQVANLAISQMPIVVIASNRPFYLHRMLSSLLQTHGINSSRVTVFVDGFYEEPIQVAQLFNLRAIQQRPRGSRSARISHHYRSALTLTFEHLHPRAKYALILEEDLEVARDILVYFNQTIELLERDSSLYCASAWNDQGYEHAVSGDAASLMRIETMPGLGWLLSRKLFLEELAPNWPSFEQPHDWDMWIRTPAIRKGRECVIPEVSRTFHFGGIGTNINSYFQSHYFSKHAFNLMSDVSSKRLADNMRWLGQDEYEQLMRELLSKAKVIRRSGSHYDSTIDDQEYLCSLADEDPLIDVHLESQKSNRYDLAPSDQRTSVIFIKMIELDDYANWLRLAGCWRLWDLDARGQHKAMWRLNFRNQLTFVVGSPVSPYAKLYKPDDLEEFDMTPKNKSRI